VGAKTCEIASSGKNALTCLSGYANADNSYNGYCVAC